MKRKRAPDARPVLQKCVAIVAQQRGSKIRWTGEASAAEVQQPPAFHSIHGRGMFDSISSTISVLTNGSEIDTSYLDESPQQLVGAKEKKRSGFDEADWEQYGRRRRNHAERLSSSSGSVEQHLSDLFEDAARLEK